MTSELWFPVHPRWLSLLRTVGIILAALILYIGYLTHTWPVPSLLLLWLLFVRPVLRPATPFYRVASILHGLLLFTVFASIALIAYVWLQRL